MLLTLTCDGSYCRFSKLGGYAFWISSDAGAFKNYGSLPDCKNSCEAEMMALGNALHYCRTHPQLKSCTKIIVNMDRIDVQHILQGKGKKFKRNDRYKDIAKKVNRYFVGLDIEFRHVKAHTKDLSKPRAYVNDWVDKMAVKARKNQKKS